MKASGSIKVFTGILVFILIWLVVTQVLEMKLLGSIFNTLMNVGVLALIVLFQDEIRRFLFTLGSHQHVSALARFFTGNKKESLEHEDIMPVVMACISMGKQKVGALIVIEHNVPLDNIVRTGELINANVNQRLIENIFFKNSPLHDGAMVISKKRIKAAGCILLFRTIWIFPRNWDCAIGLRWEFLRSRMHMPLLCLKKPALFLWLIAANFIFASMPKNWKAC